MDILRQNPGLQPLAELAGMYGYASPASLRQAHYRGALKCEKIGRDLYSTVAWVEEYLAARPRWHQDGRKRSEGA